MKKKIIEYSDEKEEFSGISRKTVTVDSRFKYIHSNPIWKFLSFIVYRIIMTPFAFLWCKIKFHYTVKGKEKLRICKKQGYFIYSNHTLMAGDAFIPNMISFPKKNYVIVNADNISVKGTKNFIMMCGAIPVPTSLSGYRNFNDTVKKRINAECSVTVYPEAHIWPYYTGIREFPSVSFSYPVKMNAPVFSSTTTYQKKIGKTPKITVFVDGPFYPNSELNLHDAENDLRNRVYGSMLENSKNSTYSPIQYVKK